MASKKRWRESRLGRFVTPGEAKAHPDTTVGETINDAPDIIGSLLWRLQTCESVMLNAAATLTGFEYDPDRVQLVADELEKVARDRIPEELDA